jgi:hypothetical protein
LKILAGEKLKQEELECLKFLEEFLEEFLIQM